MTQTSIEQLLVGESPAMRRLRDHIRCIAPTGLPVLIQGPTGSGKELVARAIHLCSERKGDVVALNVCAVSDGMVEDVLFGHVRGAFTGAAAESAGLLAEANGGSIFLDEIGGLSLHVQAKLLRAIETRQYRPIGARSDRRSDFRVISAANECISTAVAHGHFRADLGFRLSGDVIDVPPLRSRLEDIPLLAHRFLSLAARREVTISDAAAESLYAYEWPGNVRELRHVVERALAYAGGGPIAARHIDAALERTRMIVPTPKPVDPARERLTALLREHDWSVQAVAAAVGVHFVTVYRWMQRYGITPKRSAAPAALSRAAWRDTTAAVVPSDVRDLMLCDEQTI